MNNILASIEHIHPRNLKYLTASVHRLVEGKLWLQVLVAMVLGVGAGILLSPDMGWIGPDTARAMGEWISLPGKLFLAFIQIIVIPLILSSVIRGIAAATSVQQLKSTGKWLGVYFVSTVALAVVLGIILGNLLRPGEFIDASSLLSAGVGQDAATRVIEEQALVAGENEQAFSLAEIPEQITRVIPTNPMSAIVEGDMLQIVIFAIVLGIGILSLKPDSARPLMELFGAIQEVCMGIVGMVMRFAPLAVFGLLAQAMISTGPGVLSGLGVYAVSVVAGMALLLVVYLAIASFLGARNPLEVFAGIREPILLAFSTDSSAATMPVSIKSAEERLKVRSSIAQLVIPLGATINMGGTALYQGLATIFMAQMFQIDLTMGALVALVATAVGASIGTPAVPGVGIIVLAGVLSSAGVPLTGLALIIGVDQILERFRASLNVTGDLVACILMNRIAPEPETLP